MKMRMRIENILPVLASVLAIGTLLAHEPGGVRGALHWQRSSGQSGDTINHHLTGRCQAVDTLVRVPIQTGAGGLTLIGVSEGSTEQPLLSISDGSRERTVVTTSRVASLIDGSYINYSQSAVPQICTYITRFPSDSLGLSRTATIGRVDRRDLPVSGRSGQMAEYLLYGRPLSYAERRKVESYLALKYGITLSHDGTPLSYVSPDGTVYWQASRAGACVRHVAGIGHDSVSGLDQHISGSSAETGVLEMSADSSLRPGQYLVWADDGGSLRLRHKRGETSCLERTYRIEKTGSAQPSVMVRFNGGCLVSDVTLSDISRLWLAINATTGTRIGTTTRFVRGETDSLGWTVFRGVEWDTDGTGSDQFTLVSEPDLFVVSDTVQPTCAGSHDGRVSLRMAGGTPPFRVTFGSLSMDVATTDTVVTIDSLFQGLYPLIVIDSLGRNYTDTLLLSNSGMPDIPVYDPVVLSYGGSQTIDASANATSVYSYEWTMPDGTSIAAPELTVSRGGSYQLAVTDHSGCTTRRELDVYQTPQSRIDYVRICPNPTFDGNVQVRVQLRSEGAIVWRLLDADGRTCARGSLRDEPAYAFTIHLPSPGTWLVQVNRGKETRTVKAIRR